MYKICLFLSAVVFILLQSICCFANDDDIDQARSRTLTSKKASIPYYFQIKYNPDTGALLHEKFPIDTFHQFIEEVLFLLPLDLVQVLAGNNQKYYQFYNQCRFVQKHDYWARIAKHQFSKYNFRREILSLQTEVVNYKKFIDNNQDKYLLTDKESEIRSKFAKTIKLIYEYVNYSPKDMTGELMSTRMSQFIDTNNIEYLITYDGDRKTSVDDAINRFEAFQNYNNFDELFHVSVVTTTAELWTSIWKSAGFKNHIVPKQVFIVTSANIDLKPTLDLSLPIKDYTEWSIVANRDHLMYRTAWVSQLVEKRIDDYVYDRTVYNIAQKESAIIKKLKGIHDPVPIFNGKSICDAIKFQQNYFSKITR